MRAHFLRKSLILLLAEILILGTFLITSQSTYRMGFPLDDAWIHQTYARNLAEAHQWAYLPGVISGGSTSPFWTFLLSIGFFLHLSPLLWTDLIGGILLFCLAALSESLIEKILPDYHPKLPVLGLLVLAEWHLDWAALSGMETLLIALFVMLELHLLVQDKPKYFLFGLLAGGAVWIRPDGLSILIPGLTVIFFSRLNIKDKFHQILLIGLGFSALFLPYLGFNQVVAGTPWPNTFYAKQAEYADLLKTSIFTRFINEIVLPFIGVGCVLLTGGLITFCQAIKRKNWFNLGASLWVIAYLFVYAWRLPVTYQHGRYVIPTIPVIFLICFQGFWEINRIRRGAMSGRILSKAWSLLLPVTTLAFLILGGKAYATDVAIVESNMVDTAIWIRDNTNPNAVIAAHDIGAIGYFSNREILDLAGLINPAIIPFIQDEGRLKSYLDQQHVDYLVTFPDWYSLITQGKSVVFFAKDQFIKPTGQLPMCVYIW